jgi:hypothetical protein
MCPIILWGGSSTESFFNIVKMKKLALFEHLSFELFEEFDVFPGVRGRGVLGLSPLEGAEPIQLLEVTCTDHVGEYVLRPRGLLQADIRWRDSSA